MSTSLPNPRYLGVSIANATPMLRRKRYHWMIPGNLVGVAILVAILVRWL